MPRLVELLAAPMISERLSPLTMYHMLQVDPTEGDKTIVAVIGRKRKFSLISKHSIMFRQNN